MPVRTGYGIQVDAWGALLMDKGEQGDKIEEDVIANIEKRGLDGLSVKKGGLKIDGVTQEHVIVQQDLGSGGRATAALRIAKRGTQDLEIGWRLFERNVNVDRFAGWSQGALVSVGLFCIITGLFGLLCMAPVFPPLAVAALIFLVPGLMMVGTAWGWWGASKKNTSANAPEQYSSRALSATLDHALMQALTANGVVSQDLKVLQRAQTEGLGKLSKTDWAEEVSKRKPDIDL